MDNREALIHLAYAFPLLIVFPIFAYMFFDVIRKLQEENKRRKIEKGNAE